jgi:hypothetical protein
MFVKYKYPDKVSLYERCGVKGKNGRQLTLGDLLESWMGPRYRRRVWQFNPIQNDPALLPPQFLLRDVYGHRIGCEEENALAKRYLEYSEFKRNIGRDTIYILPHPFNKGTFWYAQALEAIKNDAKETRGRALWHWNAWMSFWMSSETFGSMTYMEKLKVLQWFEHTEWVNDMRVPGGRLLDTPMMAEKMWWSMKRRIRWAAWWIGDLPDREPFPGPTLGQRRVAPLRPDSVYINLRYT